jgi:hypothetical protein
MLLVWAEEKLYLTSCFINGNYSINKSSSTQDIYSSSCIYVDTWLIVTKQLKEEWVNKS